MTERETDVLDLLAAHELAIKRLYEARARCFPEQAELWSGIAAEEQRHADWLAALRSETSPAGRSWLTGRFKPQAIRLSTTYVEERADAASKSRLDLRTALSVSRDIEDALLERLFSGVDAPAPPETRTVLQDLAAETDRHRQAFAEALAALPHP